MYYEISCKDLELTEGVQALVHEKLGLLEHLMRDYPPESVMAGVRLIRWPIADEYYNVRVNLELPGDRCYAQADSTTLENALINAAGELERQLSHILSRKRNEEHWKRIRRPSETVRRTVPVNESELVDIQEEVQHRTEEQQQKEKGQQKAA